VICILSTSCGKQETLAWYFIELFVTFILASAICFQQMGISACELGVIEVGHCTMGEVFAVLRQRIRFKTYIKFLTEPSMHQQLKSIPLIWTLFISLLSGSILSLYHTRLWAGLHSAAMCKGCAAYQRRFYTQRFTDSNLTLILLNNSEYSCTDYGSRIENLLLFH
jgi:hypothetical protein